MLLLKITLSLLVIATLAYTIWARLPRRLVRSYCGTCPACGKPVRVFVLRFGTDVYASHSKPMCHWFKQHAEKES